MPSSKSRNSALTIAACLCGVQLLLAVVLGRQSCDWSLAAYVLCGALVLGVLVIVPHVLRRAFHRHNRTPVALFFGIAGLLAWMIGLGLSFGSSNCGIL